MSAVARRYAKAVFSLAQDEKQIDAMGQQLRAAADLLWVPALRHVITSPLVSASRRRTIVQGVKAQLGLLPTVEKFLLLLADRHRLDEMPSIADQFQRLEDQSAGRARIVIRSAAPLIDAQRDQIVSRFQRALGKTIVARTEVDAQLVGGVVVEAEGKVYDGSVRTQLETLAKQIARTEIPS
jgi:F-type H+-transporting ATPase subunit delta